MRLFILEAISHFWDKDVFPNVSMKSFFVDIYKFLILLEEICLDKTHAIAIHAERSKQWIALYLACYIKGIDFIVLSPNLSREQVLNTLNFVSVSYLFTEPLLISFNKHDMKYVPFLKGAYDIATIRPIALRRSVYNENVPHLSLHTVTDALIDKRVLNEILHKYENRDEESYVMNLTSGISHLDTKITVSSSKSIKATVIEGKNLLPYNEMHSVYSAVEFAHSHIITVLIPFIVGCKFNNTEEGADIIIESTSSFEKAWYEAVDFIFEFKFLNWVFKKRMFNGLFNKIAGKFIKEFYKNVKHIIVYNGHIHERALNVAKKYLPLHVTYGSQETNQLMACNDFSASAYCKPGSVGRLAGLLTLNKHKELEFESYGTFCYYLGDDPHTNYIKKDRLIKTGDQGAIENGNIVLKGRMSSVYQYGSDLINFDEIERHIRSLPYIEECILIPWDDDVIKLLVRVNERLIGAHKLGWYEISVMLNKYYNTLAELFDAYVKLDGAAISQEPFLKSFDGKIKAKYYRFKPSYNSVIS